MVHCVVATVVWYISKETKSQSLTRFQITTAILLLCLTEPGYHAPK